MKSDSSKPEPIDRAKVQAVYDQHVVALERFLLGVLRDDAAAADALQTTFIRLLEKGHLVQQQDSIKSWLFRVAFNEAMLIRRRESISRRHAEGVAWKFQMQAGSDANAEGSVSQSVLHAMRQEDIQQVRTALQQLAPLQRQIVEKRIYEGLKFREISEELDIPLGTVLARMQAGLRKLKPLLREIGDPNH